MSALDRAFIRAYAKDAAPTSPPRAAAAPTSHETPTRAAAPYDTGPLYRVDYQPAATAPVVPPAHQKFARTGNSLRSRYTTVSSQDVAPEPPAPQPAERLIAEVRPLHREPPPRNESKPHSSRTPGLDHIARRLAGSSAEFDSDLPLVVEEPIARPTATNFVETVAAPVAETKSVTAFQPFDFVPAPSILIFTPALDLAAHAASEPPPVEVKPEPTYRLDPPAAAAIQGPHFKLKPPAEKPPEAVALQPPVEAPVPPTEAKSPAPAWEVDAFQWPEVCQKLLSDSSSYFAQAGAKLTAAVKDGLHSLAVAGSARGEGASTLALSLAKAAVAAGLNVALVDADFVDPQLALRLGLDIDAGWQAAANGHVPLHEAAVRSLTDKLTFFPLQKNAELALTDPWAVATLRKIQESYDLVLVDLGPIAAGDAPLFAKGEPAPFDAVVIVRDVRRTPLDHAQAVAGRLYAAGVEAVGIAENFVS